MTNRRRADRYTRHCEAVKENGEPCGAWARRDSDPPRCALHSESVEERAERARKAAAASSFARRSKAEPRHPNGLRTDVSLADVLKATAPALTAVYEATGEPDWGARLSAVAVLVLSFPRQLRDRPEKVEQLIRDFLPREAADQKGMRERLLADEVYRALRREWDRLPQWSELRGLYWLPYPRQFVPPWQSYEEVVKRELPPDIAPAEAPVRRLPDGRALLDRRTDPPLLLEPVDDGGAQMRATSILR